MFGPLGSGSAVTSGVGAVMFGVGATMTGVGATMIGSEAWKSLPARTAHLSRMVPQPDDEAEEADEINEPLDRLVNFLATYLP